MKLIKKIDNDKKLVKKWRPISLLNVTTKLISKMLAERLKTTLPFLISKFQTAYIKRRFISEGGRLMSHILEISDNLKIKRFLMTLDVEILLIRSLEKYDIDGFIKWIQILIQNQETCVINGGTTAN